MAKKKPASSMKFGPDQLIIGKHPDTGVIHRLTINPDDKIKIERTPYVSNNPDGWTHHYETLHCEASKHTFLLIKIIANPCDWPG
ncbi:hypothetical protein GCM10028805_22730 [Spirosoma harenae]